MGTPAIAHFGTTIMEAAPPPGTRQQDVPLEGTLGRTLEFLDVLGFKPHLQNMYEGIGRQYIWRRGEPGDVDYVEQDNFTSYVAEPRPDTDGPRIGDTVFRLTHSNPTATLQALLDRNLITVSNEAELAAFLDGTADWLLMSAPQGQVYEFGATQADTADNHCVYVWTDEARLEEVAGNFIEHFGMTRGDVEDFHGVARLLPLRRKSPGVTIGLLHHPTNRVLAPRWTDDIFKEAGFSHYRMGALDKAQTVAFTRQAFPDGGDVSFVYFEDSYLELVQA